MWKLQTFCESYYKQIIAWFVRDIWHKNHKWYFKIVSNFTRPTARKITYNNFEVSLVVFIPNITTNYAIIYTNKIETVWSVACKRKSWARFNFFIFFDLSYIVSISFARKFYSQMK